LGLLFEMKWASIELGVVIGIIALIFAVGYEPSSMMIQKEEQELRNCQLKN